MDQNGDPAANGYVELYAKYSVQNGRREVITDWQKIGEFDLDGSGQLNLSNAAIPEGNEIVAIAFLKDAAGNDILRYGKVTAPGTLVLDGPLVETTFEIDPAIAGGVYLFEPLHEDLPPTNLYTWTDIAWMPPGEYDVIYSRYSSLVGFGHMLQQMVTLSGEAATVTTDLTDTATISWSPTAGRSYDWIDMTLRNPSRRSGMLYHLPTTGGSITVKQGEYRVAFNLSLADANGDHWEYYLADPDLTVPAGGLSVQEGSLTTLLMGAPSSVKPGETWEAWYDYRTDSGAELWSLYKEAEAGSEILARDRTLVAAPSAPGRTPSIWALGEEGKGPTELIRAASSEVVYPTLQVTNSAGAQVNTDGDTYTWFYSHEWDVPAKFTAGKYTAQVTLDGGPLGKIENQQELTVGQDTVTDGVRVRVTNAAGQPVPDAEVSLLQGRPIGDGKTMYVAAGEGLGYTDANGYARLYAPNLKAGAKVKLAVKSLLDDQVWAIVKDVTLPREITVSLAEARKVTVTALGVDTAPVVGGSVGVAYIDSNGDVILPVYESLETDAQGKVTFNLGPGTVRFTSNDWANRTFTVGNPVTIATKTSAVTLPAGPLTPLRLSESTLAPDGSPLAPSTTMAFPGELPGIVFLADDGERLDGWKVTPGLYHHIGDYLRTDGEREWIYSLTGDVVVGTKPVTIDVGGPFGVSMEAPRRFGPHWYTFPVSFTDDNGNALIGMGSRDPALGTILSSMSEAVQGGDWGALSNHPTVARMRENLRAKRLGAEQAMELGVQALSLEIAPFLVIRDEAGEEIWRSMEYRNWFAPAFGASAEMRGRYEAEVLVGVGPEGTLSTSTPFEISPVNLTLSPSLYNPTGGAKLNITLELPGQDSYAMEIRNAQGALVKSLGSGSTVGFASKTWDGKNASGKTVPNGNYQVHVSTQTYGTATKDFRVRVPQNATVPSVTVPAAVKEPAVTVTGSTNANFLLAVQLKAPGATGFVAVPGDPLSGSDGKYSFTLPLEQGEGSYQLQVKSIDPDDEENDSRWSNAVNVKLDMTRPTLALTSPVPVNDALLVKSDKLTLQGTTEPGARVEATAVGTAKTYTKFATASNTGSWKIENLQLSAGQNGVTLRATDAAGNGADPVSFTVTVDRVAPGLQKNEDGPIITLALTREQDVVQVRPVVAANGMIKFFANGTGVTKFELLGLATEPLRGFTISPAAKAKSPTVDVNLFAVQLLPTQGSTTTYTTSMTDLAGNVANLPPIQVTLDSTAPTVSIDAPTGQPVAINDWDTGTATLVLSGKGSEDLSTVRVFDTANPGEPLPADVRVTGKNYTATVTLPIGQVDQTVTLRVIGLDMAGNPSTPHTQQKDIRTVKIDVTAPAQPRLTSPALTDGALLVNGKSITLTGTAEAGSKVTAQVGDGAPSQPATANASGAYSLSVTLPAGQSTVKLWAADAAGNRSEPFTFTVTLDQAAPVVATLDLAVDGEERPLVKGKSTYAVSVPDADSYVLGGSVNEPIRKVQVNGKDSNAVQLDGESFTLNLTSLKNGSNTLALKVYDLAGNALSITVAITLDTVRPTVTISESNQIKSTSKATFTVTSKEALSDVQVESANGESIEELTFSAAASKTSAAKWTVTVTMPTEAYKSWSLRFRGVDLAGNVGTADPKKADVRTLTIDPVAPELNVTAPAEELVITKATSITVTGTVSDLESGLKSLTVGGASVTPNPDGSFSKKVSLTDGKANIIEVKATDKAGNISTHRLEVVRKSSIKTPTLSKYGPSKGKLTISGTADVPVVLSDGTRLAVTVEVAITSGTETIWTRELTPANSTGKYSTVVDLADMPKGTYTIEVLVSIPEEYEELNLTLPALKKTTFTIR